MSTSTPTSSGSAFLAQLLSGSLSEQEMAKSFEAFVQLPITATLLAECTELLRQKMIPVDLPNPSRLIDSCGTGGSGKKTVNTSTLTALLVAAAGGKVAKHGNRSASGNCGCFDLLERLDIKIDLTPMMEQKIFEKLGIVFLFAPLHHPALRLVGALRKNYGKKTIFNLFGPLCNPAGVQRQLIGTGNEVDAKLIADTLFQLGSFGSKVVTGKDGLDEVTNTTDTIVFSVDSSGVQTSRFSPRDISIPLANEKDIEGGSPDDNVKIFLELIQGKGHPAKKDLVLLNAAYALILAEKAPSVREGFILAKETLESGKAFRLFQQYKELSTSL